MALCNITGTVYLPSGELARSRTITFSRVDKSVRAEYLGAVVPVDTITQTNSAGEIDVSLLTGRYVLFTGTYSGGAVVPEALTASIADVLTIVTPTIPVPAWLAQALAARDAAIAAADDAQDSADAAAASAAGAATAGATAGAAAAVPFATAAASSADEASDFADEAFYSAAAAAVSAGEAALSSASVQPYASYAAALSAVGTLPTVVRRVSWLNTDGKVISATRQSGGPCLGGGWIPDGASRPEHFGVTGTTNDVAPLLAWVEYGGIMTAGGTYGIPSEGANSGGVRALVRRDIDFVAEPTCKFIAGLNLDANIFRLTPSPSAVAANGRINIKWIAGYFNQELQCNSTSIPFSDVYPPIRPGASATTDALYIVGDITVGGVVVPGYERVEVAGVRTYAGAHWQIAGGDSGVFVTGAVTQSVHDCRFVGNRDLGYYGSGLGSGQSADSAVYHYNNVYVACCMGGSVKRQQSRVFINNNVGFNAATVVSIQGLTGTAGEAYEITGNVGYNAHQVVRIDDSGSGSVTNNKSFNHGHILADGSAPTSIFNARNCVVRFDNAQGAEASANTLVSIDSRASVSAADVVVVRLWNGSANNLVRTNRAMAGQAVVREEVGAANFTTCYDNLGTAAMTLPVELTGAGSVDLDLKGVMDAASTSYPSSNATQDLKSVTLPNWFVSTRLDEMQVFASGTVSGTSGLKTFELRVGGVTITFPDLPQTFEGQWNIRADVVAVSATSIRVTASLNGAPPIYGSGTSTSRPITARVRGRTWSSSDTITQAIMRIT